MPKLLIRNGRVLDPAAGRDEVADILIKGGLVVRVGQSLTATGAIAFDARGLVVAPGFIDLHTHLHHIHDHLERRQEVAHLHPIDHQLQVKLLYGFLHIQYRVDRALLFSGDVRRHIDHLLEIFVVDRLVYKAHGRRHEL